MADNRKKNILRYSKYIHLKIECEINTMLAGKGITAAQSHILMYIMEHNGEPVFSTAIHHDLNISRATVSGLIKKLRAGGYLNYEGSDEDERHKKIIATQKAYDLQQDICDCLEKIEASAFCNFSDEEIDHMETLQRKMIDNIYPNNK